MRILLLTFAAVLGIWSRSAAHAQAREQTGVTAETEARPDESEADFRARGLFLAGQAAYNRAQFEEALGYFEGAYQMSNRPELLFNIGLAAQRAGQRDRALDAFRQYVREVPGATNRPDVEARIGELEAASASSDTSEAGNGPGVVPWIVIGASAAVAIAGAIFVGIGVSDVSAVEGAPRGAVWDDYQSRYDRAPVLTTVGFVMLGVGVAGAALGVVLFATSGSDDSTTVSLGPGSLRVRGTF